MYLCTADNGLASSISPTSVKLFQCFLHTVHMQEYLKKMWAHSPQEEGHHPSKYLSPMVHTSSSKGCLVSSPPSSKARASSLHDSETGTDEDSHESLTGPHSAPDQFALFQHMLGKGSSKGEPMASVQRGKRTRNNSFYVAMAASTFKKRPDRHRAKIKYVPCTHTQCPNIVWQFCNRVTWRKTMCYISL